MCTFQGRHRLCDHTLLHTRTLTCRCQQVVSHHRKRLPACPHTSVKSLLSCHWSNTPGRHAELSKHNSSCMPAHEAHILCCIPALCAVRQTAFFDWFERQTPARGTLTVPVSASQALLPTETSADCCALASRCDVTIGQASQKATLWRPNLQASTQHT